MGSKVQVVPLVEVVRETKDTMTYRFRADFGGTPGQFVMAWIPRSDELPMALSYLGPVKGITVRDYGNATHELMSFRPGDRIGVRGPYGNTFRLKGERVLFVAGGSGVASVIAAVESFAQQGSQVVTAIGARTADDLLFVDRASASGEVHVATDDGSRGLHGFAPALAEKLMAKHSFDQIVTCGPEKMMKAVVDLARSRKIAVQASLERYMKCGIGICDACALDDRLVCVDGPIFDGDYLAESEDFGRWRRGKDGRRIPV
jgi:dihydroorotate dehydrogenase electron transfer subunit